MSGLPRESDTLSFTVHYAEDSVTVGGLDRARAAIREHATIVRDVPGALEAETTVEAVASALGDYGPPEWTRDAVALPEARDMHADAGAVFCALALEEWWDDLAFTLTACGLVVGGEPERKGP